MRREEKTIRSILAHVLASRKEERAFKEINHRVQKGIFNMRKVRIGRRATKIFLCALSAFLTLALFACAAIAQTETGQITGKVTDPTGAIVPGTTVNVKSVDTGRVVTAVSTDEGVYTVAALQPGLYDVTAQAGSFKPTTKRIQVTVGSRVTYDIQLALSEVSGSVDVVAQEGVEVNTQSQELSNVVSGTQIRQLPTLTRNPYDLIRLSNNVASDDPGRPVPGAGASSRGAGFSINGQRAASTDILLDGVDNTDLYVAAVGQQIPLDAVSEFRVVTSNFSAEYGRATGGIINVATRAGTKEFHGSGYEFNRVSRLASNGFYNNANNVPRGVFTRNQFGYTIGGPVVLPRFGEGGSAVNRTKKLFFFNSTEWTRVRSVGDVLSVVPTAQLIAASNANTQNYFSRFQLKATPAGTVYTVGNLARILNLPTTGNAFTALPAALPAFQLVRFTEPTELGGGIPQNKYSTVTRVDYNLSNKTLIYGRWARESELDFKGSVGFSPYAGFDTPGTVLNNSFLISLTHTFSSSFVSETKLALNRLHQEQPYGDQPIGPGLFIFPGPTGTVSGNPIAFPGYWPYNGASSPVGFGGPQNVGQVYEDLTYTRGRHQFKFGGVAYYIQDNRFFGAYDTAVESLSANGGDYATALNNFVGGVLGEFQAAIFPQGHFPGQTVSLPVGPPDFTRSNRYNEWAVYLNDSWRVRPRFTLNLGMRYEYYGVQHNKNPNLDSNFYFGTGNTLQERIASGSVQIAGNSPVGGLWKPDKNNFAPRLGFAWDVRGDGKMSLRGGYGMAYERNFGNVTFNIIQNPPNYLVLALVAPTDIPVLPITLNNFGPLSGNTPPTKTIPKGSLRHVRQDIVNAYAHFYSLSFEKEMGAGNLFSVAYSGSAGRKLYTIDPYNQPGSGHFYLGLPGVTTRLNSQFSGINARGNDGYSNYNSVSVSFDGNNFRHKGVQFTAHYTYAVNKDNLSTTFSESNYNNNLGLTNPFNPSLDYGYSDLDVRHRFVGSVIWTLPFAKQSHGVEGAILGGWQLTSIFNARTGTPFTIYDSAESCVWLLRLWSVPCEHDQAQSVPWSELLERGCRNIQELQAVRALQSAISRRAIQRFQPREPVHHAGNT
ncbi:MAG: TonB-dependent receptor [Acidobacteria bacterium]|nr:MAG: TonB-dependent receptor [Acidobacteriota bacterium]